MIETINLPNGTTVPLNHADYVITPAFKAGTQAFFDGKGEWENPYIEDVRFDEHREWLRGWQFGYHKRLQFTKQFERNRRRTR